MRWLVQQPHMSGVARTTVSVAVVMFELTNTLTYTMPVMLGVLVAKTVANFLGPKWQAELACHMVTGTCTSNCIQKCILSCSVAAAVYSSCRSRSVKYLQSCFVVHASHARGIIPLSN